MKNAKKSALKINSKVLVTFENKGESYSEALDTTTGTITLTGSVIEFRNKQSSGKPHMAANNAVINMG